MKLSVIIPCYDEDISIIERAVNSVKGQLYYSSGDVEIIVSCDLPGREPKIDGVTTIATDANGGPGVARQRGLDACHGEYVCFVDADDLLYNSLAYALFLKDIYWRGGDQVDIAKFPILEQLHNGEFVQKELDSTWCFSKIYRRKFLIEKNIRFRPDLRIHEDSYFVRYAELHQPRILNHGDMVYLWMHNPQSTVRRNNGEYWQAGYSTYIDVIYSLQRAKHNLGYDTQDDGLYNFAYSYANISRMDKPYVTQCLDAMRCFVTPGTVNVIMAQQEALSAHVRAAESRNNLPGILPNMTVPEFAKLVKGGAQ